MRLVFMVKNLAEKLSQFFVIAQEMTMYGFLNIENYLGN